LVLFDIDGTLVRRSGPHHREALAYGIRRITGLETTTDGIPVQGMLDPDILTQMMRRAGASPARIKATLPDIMQVAVRYYLRVCPSLHTKHCPGVEPVLQRLERQGLLLALVTGNLTRIGWRKLDRAGLVRLAIAEARRRSWISRLAPVSLIGDAPADIAAARANRIRIICVKTGITPPEQLEALKPDFLLPNLRHLRLKMLTEPRPKGAQPKR